MRTTDKSLRKEQARYKRNVDARLRKPKYDIPVGSYVFLRKEQGTATEPKHKLAQAATGPYKAKQSDRTTVVIAIGEQEERFAKSSRTGSEPDGTSAYIWPTSVSTVPERTRDGAGTCRSGE